MEIINADCMEAMAGMPDCSVDAVVTDPPYGLAFMGAEWDSFGGSTGRQTVAERMTEGRLYAEENKGAPRYANSHGKRVTLNEMMAFQNWMTPVFREVLRVAKPGAHLLCFGCTRTFHRMACAIEDAGWEIRDCIMWVYGSGFPKSMDVGKKLPEWDGWDMTHTGAEYDDNGSSARFFYCAKASKKDRGDGNDHPTLKPTALMECLVKLVTADGQTVLDPFMGSGSTGVACERLGRRFVGIEKDARFCEIAERRLSEARNGSA